MSRIIDCTADPFVPDDWELEEHNTELGQIDWDATEITLHYKFQFVSGEDLLAELCDEPVLNANILDYLLEHPEFIPEDWKGKRVCFWGTIYRDAKDFRTVRFLYWSEGEWSWRPEWLVAGFDASSPAAVFAP